MQLERWRLPYLIFWGGFPCVVGLFEANGYFGWRRATWRTDCLLGFEVTNTSSGNGRGVEQTVCCALWLMDTLSGDEQRVEQIVYCSLRLMDALSGAAQRVEQTVCCALSSRIC